MIIEINGIEIEVHEVMGEIRVFSANGKSTNEQQMSRLLTGTDSESGFGLFAIGGIKQTFTREGIKIHITLPMFEFGMNQEQIAFIIARRIIMIDDEFELKSIADYLQQFEE